MDIQKNTLELLNTFFRPKPRLGSLDWSEKNVMLTRRVTQKPGMFSADLMPYIRGVYDSYDDSSVRTIVLCFSARSGKTETTYNLLRKNIAVDHDSFIYAAPSSNLARDWSEHRFQPSLKDCKATADEIPDNLDLFKLTSMQFKHCSGWFIGAGSASNLAGRGVRIIVADEVDKWKQATSKETGALQNLSERNRERWDRKTIITSTPTVESGQIWTEFKQSDQRYFYVPCPNCGKFQTFVHSQLKHDPEARTKDGWDLVRVSTSVYYECLHCQKPISESHKQSMMKKGEWRATSTTKEIGRVGFHLNVLYSPWTTWGEVQTQFLKSNALGAEELQKFINSWLAEPFYTLGDPKEFMDILEAAKSLEVYSEVPKGSIALLTVDVQQTSLWFEIIAYDKMRNATVLEYGQLPGFEELEAISHKWHPFGVFVDCAYAARQSEVFNWCFNQRRAGRLAVPILGSNSLMVNFRWVNVPIEGGMFRGKTIESLRFVPNVFKNEWLFRVKEMANQKSTAPKWNAPANASKEWAQHHASETPKERKLGRGKTITEWVQRGHQPNHLFDCSIMSLAAFEAVRPIAFDVPNATQVQVPNSPTPSSTSTHPSEGSQEMAELYRERHPEYKDPLWG